MSMPWVTRQLLSIRRTAEPARLHVNPKPPGVMLPGSATHAVWEWLSGRATTAWWTRQQIVTATGRTGKSVDWALLYLRAGGWIEVSQDARCTRYLRYRALRDKESR